MQTILIPTDFSSGAFTCIPALCEKFRGQSLIIVFTHLFKLSDSATDLVVLSRRSREYQYINDQFYKDCQKLKTDYPQIASFRFEFFYGSTVSVFRNFLEANLVDYILDPSNCSCSPLSQLSIDPAVLVGKTQVPLLQVSSTSAERQSSKKKTLLEEV